MVSDHQALGEALRVVSQSTVGMLCTVDSEGAPAARWMSCTLAGDDLRKLYSLAAGETHMIEHVARNPQVCWVFTAADYADVATLHGEAQLVTGPVVPQAVMERLLRLAAPYLPSATSPDAAAPAEPPPPPTPILTQVTKVEFLSRRLNVNKPVVIRLK